MTLKLDVNKEQTGAGTSATAAQTAVVEHVAISALWRERMPEEISASDLIAASDLLNKTVLIGEAKWKKARSGGAAEAIAIAIANWPAAFGNQRADLIMTALMYAAMTGSAAAALVMAQTLRQMPGAAKHHKRIASSWLARNIRVAALHSVAKSRSSRAVRDRPATSTTERRDG